MVVEERAIEVKVISATDLKKVQRFGREQKCYVVAYIYPAHKLTSKEDPYGGVNPTWNATLKLACYEFHLHPPPTSSTSPSPPSHHKITLEIYCHNSGFLHSGDKLVGTVTIPLQDVSAAAAKVDVLGIGTAYDVYLPTGEVEGTLNLSVKLGAKQPLREYEDLSGAQLPAYSFDENS